MSCRVVVPAGCCLLAGSLNVRLIIRCFIVSDASCTDCAIAWVLVMSVWCSRRKDENENGLVLILVNKQAQRGNGKQEKGREGKKRSWNYDDEDEDEEGRKRK